MADTATSLLSTVLFPVRALAPHSLTRWPAAVQMLPIIDLPCQGNAALADLLYAGHFTFSGETMSATPTTVFSVIPPSLEWRVGLQSLFWLQHFRASGKVMHARMAARLLQAWNQANQLPQNVGLAAEAILNLAIHGPHLLDENLPQGKLDFQNLLRMNLRKLARMRPHGPLEAVQKSTANLAGLIVSEATQAQLRQASVEVAITAAKIFAPDGSHVSGSPHIGLATLELLVAVSKAAGDHTVVEPQELTATLRNALNFLSLIETPHGTLAFAGDDFVVGDRLTKLRTLRADLISPPDLKTGLAEDAGVARLVANMTQVYIQFRSCDHNTLGFAIEVWRKGEVSFYGEDRPLAGTAWKVGMAKVFAAEGDMLFTLPCLTEDGGRRAISVFLSGNGADLRIENECAFIAQSSEFMILPAETGKVSPLQNGEGAVIAGGRNQSWQMTSRGAKISRDQHNLRIAQAENQPRLNLAFRLAAQPKRHARAVETGTLL